MAEAEMIDLTSDSDDWEIRGPYACLLWWHEVHCVGSAQRGGRRGHGHLGWAEGMAQMSCPYRECDSVAVR